MSPPGIATGREVDCFGSVVARGLPEGLFVRGAWVLTAAAALTVGVVFRLFDARCWGDTGRGKVTADVDATALESPRRAGILSPTTGENSKLHLQASLCSRQA